MTDDLTDLLHGQCGVLTVAQALRHLSRAALRHRLTTGRWRRLHQRVLVAYTGPLDPAASLWAAVLAAGPAAVVGGVTAAEAAGLQGYARAGIHLLVPAHRRVSGVPSGVVVHRSSILDARDVLSAVSPPRTRIARSMVDAAQWAGSDTEARAIVAACFQQRLVRGDDVNDVLNRLPRTRRRHLIALTAADAAGGSHSLAEIDFVRLCRSHRLPEPSRQVVRYDTAGRRRYLDVYFAEWRVIVEIDGGQHLDPRRAWADMRRQNELWTAGDRILRFPTWALRTRPAEVLNQLRAALIAAGWLG